MHIRIAGLRAGHFVAASTHGHISAFSRMAPWAVRPRLPGSTHAEPLPMSAAMITLRVGDVNKNLTERPVLHGGRPALPDSWPAY